MRDSKKKVKKEKDVAGTFVVVGVLGGIGIGMIVGQIAAGALIGLAAGFLVYGVIKLMKKK